MPVWGSIWKISSLEFGPAEAVRPVDSRVAILAGLEETERRGGRVHAVQRFELRVASEAERRPRLPQEEPLGGTVGVVAARAPLFHGRVLERLGECVRLVAIRAGPSREAALLGVGVVAESAEGSGAVDPVAAPEGRHGLGVAAAAEGDLGLFPEPGKAAPVHAGVAVQAVQAVAEMDAPRGDGPASGPVARQAARADDGCIAGPWVLEAEFHGDGFGILGLAVGRHGAMAGATKFLGTPQTLAVKSRRVAARQEVVHRGGVAIDAGYLADIGGIWHPCVSANSSPEAQQNPNPKVKSNGAHEHSQ
jgi:hypothetical protein